MEKRAVEVDRKATTLVERDTAKMLGVDGCWNVVWHDGASAARAHDCDDDVALEDGVAFQLLVFRGGDEAPLIPDEPVVHGVVDAKDGDAAVCELGMKEMTPKRPCSDGV